MRRRLACAIGAALLLVPFLPAPPAIAAEYEMKTVASYLVDPAAGEIAVSVAVTFTNTLPDPAGQVSAFTHVDLAIHDGASQVAATDDDGALQVDLAESDGGQVASVRTRSRVRYNRSVTFTLTYLLADAAAPDLHVRPRVVKFPAWGFGTSSEVSVELPAGFEVRADGDPMVTDQAAAGLRLTSGPIPDPDRWLAVITAVLPPDYATQSASVPLASGTVDLQVRSWNDDPAWGDATLTLLVEALPLLEDVIGLPYPRVGPLVVTEAAAGAESDGEVPSATAEIQVGFDASPFTLLHQAAHVWISDHLAQDRWIREGLASHYAARIAAALGVELPYDPAQRTADLAADARPLVDWRIGVATGADAYGYAAAWALVDRVATAIGDEHLATALGRIVAGISAYDPIHPDVVGTEGRPYPAVDTRSFLDQLAAAGGTDLADVVGEVALGPDAAAELAQRSAARDAYARLLGQAGDWGAPDPTRAAMTEWRFDDAVAGIEAASAWLVRRDALIAACSDADLVPPARLRDQYVAVGGGADASAELDAEQALVAAYVGMRTRAADTPGPLEAVGRFLATDPKVFLTEAAERFGQGDLQGAAEALDRLELQLNRAPADGAVRLAGVAAVLAIIGLGTGLTLRRRAGSHYTAGR